MSARTPPLYCDTYINRHAETPEKPLHGIKPGSPMVVTLGQQYNVGEKPTVILYTYINHHAQPPIITQHNHCSTLKRIVLLIVSIIVPLNHIRIGAWVNSKM